MKKLIDVDDDISERLEKIRQKFHIKTVQPVLDIVISMGIEAFERLINPPKEEKVYIWPWYPTYPIYPRYDELTTTDWTWGDGGWHFASGAGTWHINMTGTNYNVSYQE